MTGWYEINKNDKGQFSFVLRVDDKGVLLRSELYESKAAANNGIASVQTNSPNDERYDRKNAVNDKPYFNLKAANGQIIGTSQMYDSAALRDAGIASVKTSGPSTTIKDQSA